MKILYVDNFRGFKDTYIELKQVNFLVGENSTGKTSILSLLNLLSTPKFWFTQEFNTDEIQLGTFRDIVSARSGTKSKFRIGIMNFHNGKPESSGQACLLTFIQAQGLPLATQCDYYEDKTELNVNLTRTGVRYKTKTLDCKEPGELSVFQVFKGWTQGKRLTSNFKRLKNPIARGRKQALINVSYLISSEAKKIRQPEDESSELTIPSLTGELSWFAPIRSKPRRTYDEFRIDFTSEGAHTPYLIRKLLDNSKHSGRFKKFLSDFGKSSALLDSISIQEFGHKPTSPFELNIVLDEKSLNIMNVGYGVPQCLPVVVELFARRKDRWYAIQQPEIHLHPRAQAALGNIFYRVATEDNKSFLIETHSDYIIDRFRLNLRRSDQKVQSQVLFFERTPSGNMVTPIQIEGNGDYSSNQPKKFRDFFIKEELKLLGIR